MLKKILLGLSLGACLATSSFGAKIIDKNFCEAYNYLSYQHLVNEEYTNSKNQITIAGIKNGTKSASDTRFGAIYGQMSTDFLKDGGFGYSLNLSWGNLTVAFLDYMKYANSDEDKKDLAKFELSSNLDEIKKVYKQQSVRDSVFNIILNTYEERKNGEIGNNIGELYLTNEFASAKGVKKQIYAPFVKKILNKDYESARQYVKSVNAKSGINKIYSEFENACEK